MRFCCLPTSAPEVNLSRSTQRPLRKSRRAATGVPSPQELPQTLCWEGDQGEPGFVTLVWLQGWGGGASAWPRPIAPLLGTTTVAQQDYLTPAGLAFPFNTRSIINSATSALSLVAFTAI